MLGDQCLDSGFGHTELSTADFQFFPYCLAFLLELANNVFASGLEVGFLYC